jgi:hypothetical protein
MSTETLLLAGSLPWEAVSSALVLLMSDRLQVLGVDASRDEAQVVEFETLRDRADELLVGIAVCFDRPTIQLKATVTT